VTCPDPILDEYLESVTAFYTLAKADRLRVLRGEAFLDPRDDRGMDRKSVEWGRIAACLSLCPDLAGEPLLRVDPKTIRRAAVEDATAEHDDARYADWKLRMQLERSTR
jgi:hypothetical protein